MENFSKRTGIGAQGYEGIRYLWTDAFAVFNYLELFRQSNDSGYLKLALALIEKVHYQLGRHRRDDTRKGWISGLSETSGKRHPTVGGLRIGKKMTERKDNQMIDAEQEWDRDGQYFHYLTKWMLALDYASRISGDKNYHQWAIELAKTAYAKFTYVNVITGRKQMYWKMSIDLTYPLVESMGQHDPLDGFITYLQLQIPLNNNAESSKSHTLNEEIQEFIKMCEGMNMTTSDTLGIGGLLVNACAMTRIIVENKNKGYEDILIKMLKDIEQGLNYFVRSGVLRQPIVFRLAFRELGLSIGLHALPLMNDLIDKHQENFHKKNLLGYMLEKLLSYELYAAQIEQYWLQPENQNAKTWVDHYDINSVMLATSLAPRAFLLCH